MKSTFSGAVAVAVGLLFAANATADPDSPRVRVEPSATDELLANPGMGWQTFHRCADDDPNLQGLPSASAYLQSAPIPDGTRPEVERFLRRLGYRLVMRSVEHEAKVSVGGTTSVRIQWENTGVAPPYRDYHLAIRLRPSDGTAAPSDHVTETSIRGWLPGERRTELSLPLQPTLGVGRYELAVGVVDPRDRRPAVRLANLGRDSDGWYPVSQLEIVP